jgi:hypothetical protein
MGHEVQQTSHTIRQIFFEKEFKKIKFEKGVPIRKFSKNGYFPPDQRAGGVGPETSRPFNGREVPKLFPGLSREPLCE